jgi:hypothetical protein
MARDVLPGVVTSTIRSLDRRDHIMGQLLRVGAAGYGAKRLGGGCISTVLIFIVLFWLLGYIF